MAILDNEKIISSSYDKIIKNGYDNLKENFSKENALSYYESYKDAPLHTILEESRYIFSEPYYGVDFYDNIIESVMVPFYRYEIEYEKVDDFINQNKRHINPDQLERLESVREHLSEKMESTKHSNELMQLSFERGSMDYIDQAFDYLYESDRDDDSSVYDVLTESIYEDISDPYTFFSTALPIFEYKNDGYNLMKNLRKYYYKFEFGMSPADFNTMIESINAINIIGKDEYIKESSFSNINASFKLSSLMNESISVYTEAVNTVYGQVKTMNVLDPSDAILRIFEESENLERESSELVDQKYQRLQYNKILCENALEMAMHGMYVDPENDEYTKVVESYMGKLEEIDDMLYAMEYTEDGSPSKVLARHNQLSKVRDEHKENQQAKRKETEDDDDEEDDSKKDKPSDENKSSNEEKSDGEKKETTPRDPLTTGEKPKEDLPTKIQNKALDHEAKASKKRAENKEKRGKLANAAKAITKGPRQGVEDIKKFVKKIDEMDDARRKEYLMKPGFMKVIFHKLKTALLYYGAASASIAYLPVAMVARRFSKLKSKRMRNELVRELETEIKICDQKIDDAKAKEDKQETYRLMRIRDKLENDRLRVRTNSKYI